MERSIDLEKIDIPIRVELILPIIIIVSMVLILIFGIMLSDIPTDDVDDFFNTSARYEHIITVDKLSVESGHGDMMIISTDGKSYRVPKALDHAFDVGNTYHVSCRKDVFNSSGVVMEIIQ
jgi:hypothetical protein